MGKARRGRGGRGTNRPTKARQPQQAVSAIGQPGSPNDPFTPNVAFSPGRPLQPSDLFGPDPRLFPYAPGINIYQQPRIGERTSFETLRDLAVSFDAIQLCEQAWYDVWRDLEPRVVPAPHLLKDGQSEDDYLDDILKYEAQLAQPDGVTDILDLCQAALRDQLEIDAVAWWIQRTRDGSFFGLDVLDGASIKPLVDARGKQPRPPTPAYEQYLYGAPAGLYTASELIYMKETHRTNSMYGFSRVENFIMRVNQGIRKQSRDMARFTDGNLPAGFVNVPGDIVGWTPADLEAYRLMWNAMYAGNDKLRAQARVGLPGTTWTKIDDEPINTDFDQFLLNMACASFGVTMADLSFTDTVNRSTGESQRAVTYRRTVRPTAKRYARLFTRILQEVIGDPRFVFEFRGYEEAQDFNALAAAHVSLVTAGIESPSDAAGALKLPVQVAVPPFVMTQSGPFVVSNLARKDVQDAQVQGLLAPPAPTKPAKPGTPESPDEGPDSDASQDSQPDTDGTNEGQSTDTADSGDDGEQGEQQDETARVMRAGSGKETHYGQAALSTQPTPGEARHTSRALIAAHAHPQTSDNAHSPLRTAARDDGSARTGESDAPASGHTGIMVAFMIKPDVAEQLVLPDGLPVSEMHCTLAFLGDMTETPIGTRNPADSRELLVQVLELFAQRMKPQIGQTGGLGRFAASESSEGLSPVIALVNCPGLQDWRRELVSVLEQAGYGVAKDFDYSPHITLAYIPEDAPLPIERVPVVPLIFDVLTLAIGDAHYDFPIGLQERVARSMHDGSKEALAQEIAALFGEIESRGEQALHEGEA